MRQKNIRPDRSPPGRQSGPQLAASDKFEATSFGRAVKDAGAVKPEEINAVGFMLGDKKAGPFKMEIEWIKVSTK